MGLGGHRVVRSTLETIAKRFFWSCLSSDITAVVKSCLHCLASKGPERVPRPLGESLHAKFPNSVLHFDYLFIREPSSRANNNFRYVFVTDG